MTDPTTAKKLALASLWKKRHSYELAEGTRPVHTIILRVIRNNVRLAIPLGMTGRAFQSNGLARFASNIADFRMESQSAFDACKDGIPLGDR